MGLHARFDPGSPGYDGDLGDLNGGNSIHCQGVVAHITLIEVKYDPHTGV